VKGWLIYFVEIFDFFDEKLIFHQSKILGLKWGIDWCLLSFWWKIDFSSKSMQMPVLPVMMRCLVGRKCVKIGLLSLVCVPGGHFHGPIVGLAEGEPWSTYT
jgi:hypothetical protein